MIFMIPQLEKKLSHYIRQMKSLDKDFRQGKLEFKQYFYKRFDIDKKINAVYELNKKHIQEKEFSDNQLTFFIEGKK